MADASWLLQKAIFRVLDQGLAVPVYDSVPANAHFPYVTIGRDTSVDTSSKVESNQLFSCTIHIWSRQRGNWEVKQLTDQIDNLLHNESLVIEDVGSPGVPPYIVSEVWRDTIPEPLQDPDGLTMHGMPSYRIRISQA